MNANPEDMTCPYCGAHGLNKTQLCGPDHPTIFSGYNCTWCGTSFDRNMIIIEIGHDHERAVEHKREERRKTSWDYKFLCIPCEQPADANPSQQCCFDIESFEEKLHNYIAVNYMDLTMQQHENLCDGIASIANDCCASKYVPLSFAEKMALYKKTIDDATKEANATCKKRKGIWCGDPRAECPFKSGDGTVDVFCTVEDVTL